MRTAHVFSATGDAALRKAMVQRPQQLGGISIDEVLDPSAAAAGDVLVTTTLGFSPAQCADLVADGVKVIVLAPLPSSDQERAYASAGAVYLPMTMDVEPLHAEILRQAVATGA
jgi:hypothetical protein